MKFGKHERGVAHLSPKVEDVAMAIHRLRRYQSCPACGNEDHPLADRRDREMVLDWAESWVEFARPRPLQERKEQ